MKRCRSLLVVALAAVVALVPAACSSSVTEQQYLDHAMKFSSAAKTSEEKARTRKLFECMWPAVQKDEELLNQFMATDHPDEGVLSHKLSTLMVPCLALGSKS